MKLSAEEHRTLNVRLSVIAGMLSDWSIPFLDQALADYSNPTLDIHYILRFYNQKFEAFQTMGAKKMILERLIAVKRELLLAAIDEGVGRRP